MTERIFINYRQHDSPMAAGRIYDRLKNDLGTEHVFIDADIPKGNDWEKDLNAHLDQACVFLAVIGPNWLDIRDEHGRRRLDIANDWVRVEIATALSRNIKVIPIIINDASIPNADDLPDDLKPLVKFQTIRLRNREFDQDFEALTHSLRQAVNSQRHASNNLALVLEFKTLHERLKLLTNHLLKDRRLGAWIVGSLISLGFAAFIYWNLQNNPKREEADVSTRRDAISRESVERFIGKLWKELPKFEPPKLRPIP
jgi:TIR domain